MKKESYPDTFEAFGFTGEEAVNLKIRSKLMRELETFIEKQGFTQTEAAEFFGIAQSRISHIVNGRVSKFTIDKLINLLAIAGKWVDVSINSRKEAKRNI